MKEEKIYPLISIVMPIYNSAKFLRKSIPSVMAQEYPNLEIVLLNNGSTDESATIIEEYAKQDNRIKKYTIEHVGTPKESRDNAIFRAKGDWIIGVDSDDAIEQGYVENIWRRRIETNADCVCGIMVFVDEQNNIKDTIPAPSFNHTQVWSGAEAMLHTLLEWEIGLNGALLKRELYNRTNILANPTETIYTDECDSRKLLNSCKIVAFSEAKYYYLINPSSTGKKRSINSVLYDLITMLGLYDYYKKLYGEESLLTQGCFDRLHWDYICSMKKIIRRHKLLGSQINDVHKYYIDSAYDIIKEKRKNIGVYKWYKDVLLYRIFKVII